MFFLPYLVWTIQVQILPLCPSSCHGHLFVNAKDLGHAYVYVSIILQVLESPHNFFKNTKIPSPTTTFAMLLWGVLTRSASFLLILFPPPPPPPVSYLCMENKQFLFHLLINRITEREREGTHCFQCCPCLSNGLKRLQEEWRASRREECPLPPQISRDYILPLITLPGTLEGHRSWWVCKAAEQ